MASGAEYPAASKLDILASFHRGTLAARPSNLTVFDAGYWYLAEDEDGGTPYLWTGTAWEKSGKPVGDVIRLTQSPYNCKKDGVYLTDGAMNTSPGNVLTSATAAFTSADVGKAIAVECAGPGGSQTARMTSGSNQLTLCWLTVKINNATGGTWTYTHTGLGTVSGIAYNVTAPTLQTSLEAIYGAGKVTVTLSGTTYTITLLNGAASQDTTLVSTSAGGLTGATNGATPSITTTVQSWSYGDVGKRVHIPGAAAAGGLLTAFIGSIETTNSNIAYLVDASGVAVNAGTTGTFTYHTLNWLRTTISAVTDAHTVTLAASMDSGVQANLTGLQVYYGTDNATGLAAAVTACGATGQVLELGDGAGGFYLTTAGVTATTAGGKFRIHGRGAQIVAIPTDNEAESGRFAIGGSADTATGRAARIDLSGWTWSVPTAHYRGTGGSTPNNTVPVGVTAKTNAGGIFITRANYVSLNNMKVDTCYGLGFAFQTCRYGIVSNCEAWNTWADSFNLNNNNSTYDAPAYGDFTFIGCAAYNSGDDMFAINHHYAYSGGRPNNVSWIGCHGYQTRQFALGRGIDVLGGTNITISGCEFYGINGTGIDLAASLPDNVSKSATVSTPGTGAKVVFPAAPANVTAGTTEMQVFDGAGNSWIGTVSSITTTSVTGDTVNLAARADQAATCPFTGSNLYAQWGLSTSSGRFGNGGVNRATITGCIVDTACLNTAGDGTANAGLRVYGGNCSPLATYDIQVSNVIVNNSYQIGVLVSSSVSSTPSGTVTDVSTRATLVRDVSFNQVSVNGTGFSTLTATKPWPGFQVAYGQNIAIRNSKASNTYDNAVLVNPTTSSNCAGVIEVDGLEMDNIGRPYTTGAPLARAVDFGTQTGHVSMYDRLRLRNTLGNAGGTQYVVQYGVSKLPVPASGALTRRGSIWTDIPIGSLPNLVGLFDTPTAGQSVVISPILFHGFGDPSGVVTASRGAVYERMDGGSGTSLYVKESGDNTNTGWAAIPSSSSSATKAYVDARDDGWYYAPTHPSSAGATGQAMPNANDGRWMRVTMAKTGTLHDVYCLVQTTGGNGNVGVLDDGNLNAAHGVRTCLAVMGATAVPAAGTYFGFDPNLAVTAGDVLVFFVTFDSVTPKVVAMTSASGANTLPNSSFFPSSGAGLNNSKLAGTYATANFTPAVNNTVAQANMVAQTIAPLFVWRIS